MRLRKIALEGFQSYREHEEVDLQGLSLTAIYGKNHAGKSTLISNALDFALYGRGRSDSIGDVISRGAPRVSVSVEFDLGDSTYRVTRSRTAKGNPEAILEVSDPREESGWRALTEKNPLFTDPIILDLLGMNAQTAAMTWMIHQNDYGAFCDLLPSKRRDVLADAFGLSKFAELAKRAEVEKKKVSTQLDRATYDLDNTRSRIDSLKNDGPFPDVKDDEIEAQAKEAEEQADALAAQLASLGDNTEVKERHRHAKEAMDYFLQAHEREVSQHNAQRTQMEQYLLSATRRAKATRDAVNEATEATWSVEEHEEDLQDAQKAAQKAESDARSAQASLTKNENSYEEMRTKGVALESERAKAESRADNAKSRLDQEQAAVHEATEATSRAEAHTAALRDAQAAVAAAKQEAETAQEAVKASEAEQENLQASESDLTARIAQSKAEADAAWAQVTQVQSAAETLQQSVDSGQGVCLGCQRPLSDEEARAQIREQEEKSATLRSAYDAAQSTAKDLTSELEALRSRLKSARGAVSTARDVAREAHKKESQAERNLDLIQHELATAEALASTLKDRQQAVQKTTDILKTAKAEEAALAKEVAGLREEAVTARDTVRAMRDAVEQSTEAVSAARRTVDAAQRTLEATKALAATLRDRKKEAKEASDALTDAQASAEKFQDEPVRDEERYKVLEAALAKAAEELEATQGGEERRKEITQERAQVRDRARRLWQEQQRRTQVASDLASLQGPLKKAETSVAELTEKVETYGVLMDAFKPSGIPFMILSGVIEELNEEANEIISELGEDGLSVLITTASENKSGGTAEKVMVYAITSDGQANYSALSGSEQTRVALAIRLGLAQCIARRTGTPIETIVADECWGMFDDEGKRALMNVFIRLSERFSVFSVSHIPDVTDAFPDAIEVDMSTGTSRATVHAER